MQFCVVGPDGKTVLEELSDAQADAALLWAVHSVCSRGLFCASPQPVSRKDGPYKVGIVIQGDEAFESLVQPGIYCTRNPDKAAKKSQMPLLFELGQPEDGPRGGGLGKVPVDCDWSNVTPTSLRVRPATDAINHHSLFIIESDNSSK